MVARKTKRLNTYDGRKKSVRSMPKQDVYSLFEAIDRVKITGLRYDHFATYVATAKPVEPILTELFKNVSLANSQDR